MATLKLIIFSVLLVGFVFLGLSLKTIFRKKKNSCNDSDVGYSCGCGGSASCSANTAKKGF
ncbi:MAG: hypothetical protein H6537_10855 [Bacteroidales bacterium]|nr:hypothetical protein [Bacteroidales bacterium]HRX31875.1 hypothetical protein [Tenuifilaceae bacterium]